MNNKITFASKGININIKDLIDKKGYQLREVDISNNRIIEELYIDENKLPLIKEANLLYNEIEASQDEKQIEELKKLGFDFGGLTIDEWRIRENQKSSKTNFPLYKEIKELLDGKKKITVDGMEDSPSWNGKFVSIGASLKEEDIERFLKKNEIRKVWLQTLVNKFRQLKRQRDATGNAPEGPLNDPLKDQDRGDLGQRANEIQAYREKVKGEIEAALNQDPQIKNEELDGSNQNWVDEIWHSHLALGKKEIDDIKSRVLADIRAKRNAKKGKRERDEEENDNPNKRPKFEAEGKEAWQAIKNQTLTEIDDNVLAVGLQAAIRWEGEKEWQGEEEIRKGREELFRRNPQLYRETIITALKERMNDLNVKEEDLDEETKKLINGEFNDNMDKFKAVKDQAIKKIGELGAKNKWTSLFNQAKSLLAKVKKNVTEKVKKDIKEVQTQIKSFKSGANAYLSSYYQNKKSDVERLERDLSNYSTTTQTNSPTPWGVIIPVSLVVVALIGGIALVIVGKRRLVKEKHVREAIE